MGKLIESAAEKFGVPSEVLDLVGRDYLFGLVEDLPSLMLPPLMSDLHQLYCSKGIGWMKENVDDLRNQFKVLRQMYGPENDGDEFQKPDFHQIVS